MNLPEAFIRRLKAQRPNDYDALIDSFEGETFQGLRINTLKIDVHTFLEKFPYPLTPVPWTTDGFYYRAEDPVTKHPYYHAGLYYIQEPSAMAPIGTLELEADQFCLDLCAAPGGKSLQLATGTHDEGFLVTNDISDKRVKAIVRNVERFGLRNVLVLNETPERIASCFGAIFDHVLVDAPCSGEGMFRKDPKAVSAWAVYENDRCQTMQADILRTMKTLVKTEGRLTYSTCTFAPQENESQMKAFLEANQDFEMIAINQKLASTGIEIDNFQMRLLPHLIDGEGHYIARLVRRGNTPDAGDDKCNDHIRTSDSGRDYDEAMSHHQSRHSVQSRYTVADKPPEPVAAFMKTHLTTPLTGRFKTVKERVYLLPMYDYPINGLKVAREGLYLGDIKGTRFTPSQALALYLKASQFIQKIELPSNGSAILKYLKCETLHVEHEGKGLHLVTTDGYPVGFCKLDRGVLKNLYPASWRMF
ncbi:RsmB/NOP family class I SAM-dependent RNA methyltransferase [Fusibacter paucivorans]|uniref:RsmB/NOP family class I SAM-dependent RNA methyltransferase n=1 Tax=Fusibacter paucivorans TaxID=76009 RepID=A0ABS5PN81_9FIRM|nr:RsmB/NOP family class I SAM-dependent RNA methyltransferase [Fusibacter paucivorans]MBS7525512.1 RsmB/NOP family class I SAM-dependent RNA methyltransferase [Fusibacter paucivorans]